jgi:hypothetical protein
VNTLTERLKNDVPETLPSPSRDIEGDETVELETKAETETETQSLSHKETIRQGLIEGTVIKDYGTYSKFFDKIQIKANFHNQVQGILHFRLLGDIPSFSVKSYFEEEPELKPYAKAFEGIDMTCNVLEWNVEAKTFKFFGETRIPFHHLLIQNEKVIIMTQEEAKIYRDKDDFYNLTIGYNDRRKKLTEKEMLQIVLIKFLNGESQFNKNELKLLKGWLLEQDAHKMKDFYEKFVIQGDLRR